MTPGADFLEELQRWMLDALLAPREVRPRDVDAHILPGARADARTGLGVYQRSFAVRLRLCLGEQFPATRHALGPALFADFADVYVRDLPPASYTLDDLGRRFADWMESSRPDRDRPEDEREDWIDFLVALARYERELFLVFDGPGHEGRSWPDVSVPDEALVLQPSLVLRRYRYAVAAYYHEVRAGRAPEFPAQAESHVVVLRRDFQTTTFPVTLLHFRFLELVRDRGGIPEALAGIAAWTGRPLEDVTRSWRTDVRASWINAGFFVERG